MDGFDAMRAVPGSPYHRSERERGIPFPGTFAATAPPVAENDPAAESGARLLARRSRGRPPSRPGLPAPEVRRPALPRPGTCSPTWRRMACGSPVHDLTANPASPNSPAAATW
ncbi:hypothetical protein ACFZAU_18760 [Streptomyces sp. NPDC008238]